MKLIWRIVLLFLFSSYLFAEQFTNNNIRLLNNRFRIDETISQAAFVIFRNNSNQPVVLVKPDGEKIYFDRRPENVFWESLKHKDIITVLNPEPGPWQAIGRISPNNKIHILTDLAMSVDVFPERLYQGEMLKFTAKLTQKGEPLKVRDFLDNVKLVVNFTELIKDGENISTSLQPKTKELGRFLDDGRNLDEYPSDGVFTVELLIDIIPGQYLATISSSNGIYFRAIEQKVLVYPAPISVTFEQSNQMNGSSQLRVKSDKTSVAPDSLSLHAEFISPSENVLVYEKINQTKQPMFSLDINSFEEYGYHYWNAWVYATDLLSERALIFKVMNQGFDVTNFAAIKKANQERRARIAEQKHIEQEQNKALERARNEKFALLAIISGNLIVVLLAIGAWFISQRVKGNVKPVE